MAKRDYSGEPDYYCQPFDASGIVSVWVGLLAEHVDADSDVLQDLCGVGYYRPEDQEGQCFGFALVKIDALLAGLSYAGSFTEAVLAAARRIGLNEGRWLIAQYDFKYDPAGVMRPVAVDPIFVGSFPYCET